MRPRRAFTFGISSVDVLIVRVIFGRAGHAILHQWKGVNPPRMSSPEVLKPAWRQLGVSHRMLDISMAQIGLKGPGIVAFVSQGEAASVPEHVGVSLEAQLGLDTSALDHARKTCRRERRPPLAGEHERRLRFLFTLQLAQGPHFIADNGMGGRRALALRTGTMALLDN